MDFISALVKVFVKTAEKELLSIEFDDLFGTYANIQDLVE